MITLLEQYLNYIKQFPNSELTYEEWLDEIWEPVISDNFQIGPGGAYEHESEDPSQDNG